jgi:chromate transporter
MPENPENVKSSLSELAILFLRLGTTAFGGPAAHIAMMQDEVVRRKKWLTEQEFLDLLSVTNLIPGPNSTEMAIHVGHRQAGWAGLLVAGTCFILPAALLVALIASFYVRYAALPEVSSVMNGIKPVIIAIVLQALMTLSTSALKSNFLRIVGISLFAACFFGINEIVVLLIGGALSLLWLKQSKPEVLATGRLLIVMSVLAALAGAILLWPVIITTNAAPSTAFDLQKLFFYFVKIGSVLYGSGYVLLAFLRADLVEEMHWLTSAQLLDATAVGQVTPGPVFTTATFIGYLLDGAAGAAVATVAIFLPAFFFVAITAPFIERLRKSLITSAALDGVNVASMALMAFVTVELGRDAITSVVALSEFIISAVLLWKYKINATWLIAGGAIVGLLLR